MVVESAVTIAQELVRIPSVNPDYDTKSRGEGGVVEWLRDWAARNAFEAQTHEVLPGRSNIVMRLSNGSGRTLLFNGHTDTVAVEGMTIDPFGGKIIEGRLWGRGSADMKGPLACMMSAARQLRDDPQSWRGTLLLGFVIDEEYKFRGVQALMETIAPPDFAVVGEPTSMRPIRGCKGVLRFTIHAKGRAAHSSEPLRGRSAIVAMSECVLNLEKFQQQTLSKIQRPEFGESTLSVGLIEGGTGINIVPEHCSVQVDIRLLPGQDWKQTYAELQQFVRASALHARDIEWTFDTPSCVDPPFELERSAPFLAQSCAALGTGEPGVVFFGCDASKIASTGVPTIICGPGQIAQAHTANESIALEDLERGEELYVRLARALLKPD